MLILKKKPTEASYKYLNFNMQTNKKLIDVNKPAGSKLFEYVLDYEKLDESFQTYVHDYKKQVESKGKSKENFSIEEQKKNDNSKSLRNLMPNQKQLVDIKINISQKKNREISMKTKYTIKSNTRCKTPLYSNNRNEALPTSISTQRLDNFINAKPSKLNIKLTKKNDIFTNQISTSKNEISNKEKIINKTYNETIGIDNSFSRSASQTAKNNFFKSQENFSKFKNNQINNLHAKTSQNFFTTANTEIDENYKFRLRTGRIESVERKHYENIQGHNDDSIDKKTQHWSTAEKDKSNKIWAAKIDDDLVRNFYSDVYKKDNLGKSIESKDFSTMNRKVTEEEIPIRFEKVINTTNIYNNRVPKMDNFMQGSGAIHSLSDRYRFKELNLKQSNENIFLIDRVKPNTLKYKRPDE